MGQVQNILSRISLVTASYGNAGMISVVLGDWIKFLGGRPGEVIFIDGGSNREAQEESVAAFFSGQIDKLQLIAPSHSDNDKQQCYRQEHTCGMVASHPFLLWVKLDTLPFRAGNDNWLEEAMGHLEKSDCFCVSGSFNKTVRVDNVSPEWYRAQHASINFCLMKRDNFIAAIQAHAGEYVSSGFLSRNPGIDSGTERFLIEAAFRAFMLANGKFAYVRVEDEGWTVFHTNLSGDQLRRARENYLNRIKVDSYFNARNFTCTAGGVYYGQFLGGRVHEWRCRFGRRQLMARFLSIFGVRQPPVSPLAQ